MLSLEQSPVGQESTAFFGANPRSEVERFEQGMEFFAGGAERGLFAEKRALRYLPERN